VIRAKGAGVDSYWPGVDGPSVTLFKQVREPGVNGWEKKHTCGDLPHEPHLPPLVAASLPLFHRLV